MSGVENNSVVWTDEEIELEAKKEMSDQDHRKQNQKLMTEVLLSGNQIVLEHRLVIKKEN